MPWAWCGARTSCWYDPVKDEGFCRPLGGEIAFGEHAEGALRREFREEINAELKHVCYLRAMENLFTYRGEPGHEIVLLFEAEMEPITVYEQDWFRVEDDEGSLPAYWTCLSELRREGMGLYPDGLLELMARERTV